MAGGREEIIPSWDGSHQLFDDYRLRVTAYIAGTKKDDRVVLAGRLLGQLSGYAFELAQEYLLTQSADLDKTNGAELLMTWLGKQVEKEPAYILLERYRDFAHRDRVTKEDDVTRFWTRRRRLARHLEQAGFKVPELMQLLLFLDHVNLSDSDQAAVFARLHDLSNATLTELLPILRQIFGDRKIFAFARRKREGQAGHSAEDQPDDDEDTANGAESASWPHCDEETFNDTSGTWTGEAQPSEDMLRDVTEAYGISDEELIEEAEQEEDDELMEADLTTLEAKYHLNKLRIARGFYPVIAVPDNRGKGAGKQRDRPSASAPASMRPRGRGRSFRDARGRGRSAQGSASGLSGSASSGMPSSTPSQPSFPPSRKLHDQEWHGQPHSKWTAVFSVWWPSSVSRLSSRRSEENSAR